MKLKRTIGNKTLLFLTINAIMGTGIFFLPAVGALYAGPASIISWMIMSLIALGISLYFAELVSLFPEAGGIYYYTKKAFGNFWSFVFGWISWLVCNITIAMLIVGSLLYLFPSHSFLFHLTLSLTIIIAFNYVNYKGISLSSKLLMFFGIITVLSLIALIIPGISTVEPSNFEPFFVFPAFSILIAMYFISETFFGWETTTYLAEEVKEPRKLPRMIVISTAIICVLSLLLVFVSLGNVKWNEFADQPTPLVFLAEKLFGGYGKYYALIIFIPLIGTAFGWIVSTPRLLYAMARDKALPPRFEKIHKKYNTPYNAIIFQAIITCLVAAAAFADYLLLLSLLVPLVIMLYSGVMLSVVVLRKKMTRKREFSAPFPSHGPLIIIGAMGLMLSFWLINVNDALSIFFFGILLVLLGIPMYVLIKLQADEKFVSSFYDRISFAWDRLFPLWYGKSEMRRVIKNLDAKKNSTILDFGCGSGITTLEVAKRARKGRVVAVDISEKQIEKAYEKIAKNRKANVVFVKEYKFSLKKNSFDRLVMVNVLEHMDNPKKRLVEVFSSLKKGGKFSIMSFGRSLHVPAPKFLENEREIRKLFDGLGVKVKIMKEQKKMTEYWYIWGEK
jgi:amino acid transporter/ubiquinone/menaquinone biosynthesis C-methylase UbiE